MQSTKCWVCIVHMSYKRAASSVFLVPVCSVHMLCTALIQLHNVRAACEVCNPQYARCALCKCRANCCMHCVSGPSLLCAQAAHNTQFRVQCVCSQGVQCSVCSVCIVRMSYNLLCAVCSCAQSVPRLPCAHAAYSAPSLCIHCAYSL